VTGQAWDGVIQRQRLAVSRSPSTRQALWVCLTCSSTTLEQELAA
jgi:hypothetical protein